MATKTQLRKLLKRALDDPAFEQRLRRSPTAEALKQGVRLNAEQVTAFERSRDDLRRRLKTVRAMMDLMDPEHWPIRFIMY